ncbi:MAG: co-chaperone GroES [Candidatus Carsonella ruddii]|nr:MAG: co-chaperone GroES [Candidatus Carsonella ruddii]WMC19520.1 MAG: co-chaperone GroES [Candidatus Carsonella ruddii]
MNFFPLYDKIVVLKIEEESKVGNIFIPINENNILKGKVLEIGCGKLLENGNLKQLIVKKNDIILFKDNYNIEKYKENNIEYFFLKESDIITIIN